MRTHAAWLSALGIVVGAGLLVCGEREGGLLLLAFGTSGAGLVAATRRPKHHRAKNQPPQA